ncbi:MAG: thioredoxin [Bacteroidia bacterium]|nr:thioredoxin [Bacteroidia bacterium]
MKTILNSFKITFITIQFISIVSCNSNAQTSTIAVDEFEKGITKIDIQLLDVRTAEEYNSGHLQNALQANWNNETEFQNRVKSLDKTKPIYIYCLSGGRSANAMQWLYSNGFSKVYNMKGGINAWKQADKKLQGAVETKQISMQDYLKLIPADKTVLVDIGAEWCPPCKKMNHIIEQLEKEKYAVIKIDGGTQTELCKALKIDTFPVFIIYKNGVEVNRKEGVLSLEELKMLLK